MEWNSFHLEVEAHLVMATVFKTAEPGVNRSFGGVDYEALPLFYFLHSGYRVSLDL